MKKIEALRPSTASRARGVLSFSLLGPVESLARPLSGALETFRALFQVGLLRPIRPDQAVAMVAALRRWGLTPAAGYAACAIRDPHAPALIDEAGTLSFQEVDRRTTALAKGLARSGIDAGHIVGVLCRNHHLLIEATVALTKLGANSLYLNTSFGGPQLAGVLREERASGLIYDQEFAEIAKSGARRRKRFVAWVDGPPRGGRRDLTIESLIETGKSLEPLAPTKPGGQILLTSGTTGRPKGANRALPYTLNPLVAFVSRIPLHHRDITLISAPLYHAWGVGSVGMSLISEATVVLQRRFDPEAALAAIEAHHVSVLAAVPVMVQRIMALPEATRRRYDTASLRIVALSGSALPGPVSEAFMDYYGEIVYSLYGSTEAGWGAIATPGDLRAAPGTAGFPPKGAVVRIVDEAGRDVPIGQTGRIFVGSELLFEGYTSGHTKEMLEGLMSTGDVGHFDELGRLFVDGREDEMIVSGGENVYPQEVEDLLRAHDAVADAAVIGVPDEHFGQRLKAFVVAEQSRAVSEKELKDHVRSTLSRYKVPRDVEFVGNLPRNPTGKVLKRELDRLA